MLESGHIVAIGIDVSKESLSVCLEYQDGRRRQSALGNIEVDIKSFLQDNLLGYQGKIVMESTGRYHLLSAILLAEAGLDVRVINPLLSKKYATSRIRKVKSDREDAQLLAEVALREPDLPDRFVPDRAWLCVQKKLNLVASLDKQIQQLKSILNNYLETLQDLKISENTQAEFITNSLKELKSAKTNLERDIKTAVTEQLKAGDKTQTLEQLSSIPGVSTYVAALLAHTFERVGKDSSKQWVAYLGLDISTRESGTWHGKCRLTKRGNPYLRKRLYSAAWGAVMHDAKFKQYYEQLKQQGRKHVEALIIIARKLLRIMFSLLKHNNNYLPDKCFATS